MCCRRLSERESTRLNARPLAMVSDPAAANAVRWHLFPSLLGWLLGCLRRGRGHDCIKFWPKGTPSSVHARAPCADAGADAAASPRECPPRLRHKTVKHRRSASASMTCGVPAPAQMLFAQPPGPPLCPVPRELAELSSQCHSKPAAARLQDCLSPADRPRSQTHDAQFTVRIMDPLDNV